MTDSNPMPIIKVDACKCARCGHTWLPRDKKKRPIICPKCKSPYWDIPRKRSVSRKKAGGENEGK